MLTYDQTKTEQTVKVGTRYNIDIDVSGIPSPTVTWRKDGQPLENKDIIEIRDNYTSISISKLVRDDTGIYQVTAENNVGRDSATFTLDVKGWFSQISLHYNKLSYHGDIKIFMLILSVTDKPSPPQELTTSEVTADTVTVTWKAPESDGGSPITGYVIERQDTKRGTWINAGTVKVCVMVYHTAVRFSCLIVLLVMLNPLSC